jgi:tetratricopeptide (TPR) repeat protein
LTASVASFLAKAQKKGTELPDALSGALLLAAIRLSEAKGQAIRPYQLLVDDEGSLDLLTGDPPTGDGYAAPELRNGAVLPDDPRVLVYAAGALGYELATLTTPRPGEEVSGAVSGALGKVIRKAMAERQKRFKSLTEMIRAIEAIQGRPSKEDERVILAAVASSTPLPAAQKLAKIELEKAAVPEVPSKGEPGRSGSDAGFTEISDEPEAGREPPAAPEVQQVSEERHEAERLRADLDAERRARADLASAVQARLQELAQLATRVSVVEEQIRSPAPALSPSATMAREVDELFDQRRFSEAERVLQSSLVQHNAVLQFRLGQVLSAPLDANASALTRAEAAFRRAADLDPGWLQPRARLGLLLLRQGKRREAWAQLELALRMDPGCPEALAALGSRGGRAAGFVLSGSVGAAAAAMLLLALRPASPLPGVAALAAPPIAVSAAVPVPAKAPQAVAAAPRPAPTPPAPQAVPSLPPLPPPERPARPEPGPSRPVGSEPEAVRTPRPEAKPRFRRVATSSPVRAAAEQEAAKGDKALRAFDTKAAQAAFASALQLDPTLPAAHRGMGMVYVLLGKNAEAKAAYARYLELLPDAPDKDQIARLLSR